MNKAGLIVLCCASLGWAKKCPKDYEDGPAGPCSAYMPSPQGASAEEMKRWVSDEVAPGKGHQPDWETGMVKVSTRTPENQADQNHPKDCPNNCQWDGGVCSGDAPECNDTGKKPNP